MTSITAPTPTHSPALAPDTVRATTLPSPTGRYCVGRTSIELVDAARRERYSDDPDARRELVAWIWYPAAADSDGPPAEHVPGPWLPIADMIGVDVAGAPTHAVVDAAVADGPPFPVLLLSPSGFSPLLLSAVAEELASHGLVIVGINHTYESAVTPFADGRVVPMNPAALGGALEPVTGAYAEAFRSRAELCEYKAADLCSTLDHLAGLRSLDAGPSGLTADRLDLGRVGAIGHSFGGDAALTWMAADDRCRLAVNLDGALWSAIGATGVAKPALQILAEHPEFARSAAEAVAAGVTDDPERYEAERRVALDGWRTVDRAGRPGTTVQIAGATHVGFMDVPFLPFHPESPAAGLLTSATIDPTRMWRVTCDVLLDFVATHLDDTHPELSFGPP